MHLISELSEVATRAMIWLAGHPQAPSRLNDIADGIQATPGQLNTIMRLLGRAQLIESRRGLHGGFAIARDPKTITLLDIVNAVDPVRHSSHCPIGLAHAVTECALHDKIANLTMQAEQMFEGISVQTLLDHAGAEPEVAGQRFY